MERLSVTIAVVALLGGCSNDAASAAASTRAASDPAPAAAEPGGDKLGVAACDDFAAKVSACGDAKTTELVGKVMDGWRKSIADGKQAEVEKKCEERLATFKCPRSAAAAGDKGGAASSGGAEPASTRAAAASAGADDEPVGVGACDAYADKVRACGNKTQLRLLGKMVEGWRKAVADGKASDAETACQKVLDRYKCTK
ncbi:MAG: hypothetical protein IT373_11580 [Polyangiaceae bacterium]|nr:hypothetical protein [Polyangiaceae bacterium]